MSIQLLIADDEDIIRNGIATYIELHTQRFDKIYLAENGQQASDIIFQKNPEIMLLDVQMPVKNGIEVLSEAVAAQIAPATIILSGYDEFKYAQQALRYGASDYLLKPCRSSEILKKLHELADELFGPEEVVIKDPKLSGNYFVEIAVEYINNYYFENLTLQQVADVVGITAGYLSTLFSQDQGKGFVDYLNEVRIEHACIYLQQKYFKTYEIAFKVGFKNEKYFSKVFKKLRGMTPSEFRKLK